MGAQSGSDLRVCGYFLSYFIQREAYRPLKPGGSEVLLIDEPDAYLSTKGQQDLVKVFARYAEPDDGKPAAQVLYVTHSPFLIDKNYPHRIRVLQKGTGDEGTRVVEKAATDKYEPLRSAFSSFHADTAFIGRAISLWKARRTSSSSQGSLPPCSDSRRETQPST